jgi:acyl dehydratase
MHNFDLCSAAIGDAIPAISMPELSRTTLALFAGASGDHNPIHIDIDFARKAGLDDVFGQGMLCMAYMSRLATDIAPLEKIRDFGTRFISIIQIHARLTCLGQVVEKMTVEGENRVRLSLVVQDENDDVKLQGYAVIAVQ